MWNEERVEKLKKLWAEGYSASGIAASLGGFAHTSDGGRNAVIGKCHRLGLTGKVVRIAKPKHNQNRHRPRSQAPKIAPSKTKVVRLGNTAFRRLLEQDAQPLPVVEELEIPLAERKTVETLTASSCRWPIGDPQEPDFHFCGKNHVAGLPYCEFHARRAFNVTPHGNLGKSRPGAGALAWKHTRASTDRADIKIDLRTLEEVEA